VNPAAQSGLVQVARHEPEPHVYGQHAPFGSAPSATTAHAPFVGAPLAMEQASHAPAHARSQQ
jgi:hypothetical protein